MVLAVAFERVDVVGQTGAEALSGGVEMLAEVVDDMRFGLGMGEGLGCFSAGSSEVDAG